MFILGLGGSTHDFSACLLKDSQILAMIEDERITRNKHGIDLGVKLAQGYSRKYCLKQSNISLDNIALMVSNDIVNKSILFRLKNVKMINHHLSHAASSFYCSPFKEAAILVIDAVGSKLTNDLPCKYETISYFYGKGNKIELIEKKYGGNILGTDYVENSLGIFYSLMTELIGFNELQEGKTMGLAPYGTNKEYMKLLNYVSFSNGEFYLNEKNIKHLVAMKDEINSIANTEHRFIKMSDYAFAAQKILEDVIVDCCNYLKSITNCNNVCLAGGTFLNSVANYKIYKSGIFKNIFIQPAAGDNGTSIGAALYGYYDILNHDRIFC